MELLGYLINNTYDDENLEWCNRNIYINEDRLIRFNKHQLEVFSIKENKKAFLMPRQSGKTTLICSTALSNVVINPGSTNVIISPSRASAKVINDYIITLIAFSHIDDIVDVITSNRNFTFKFNNGSEITILYHGIINSYINIDFLYIDDFDYYDTETISLLTHSITLCNNVLVLGTHNLRNVKYLDRE